MVCKKSLSESSSLKFKPVVSDVITTEEIEAGASKYRKLEATTIIFILRGSAFMTKGKSGRIRLEGGSAFVLPIGSVFTIEADENTWLSYFSIDERVFDNDLYYQLQRIGDAKKGRQTPYLLHINEKLWIFLTHTISFISDGLSDSNYQVMKTKELFHILNAYYSPKALTQFYKPLTSRDSLFAGLVYENWRSTASLEELATLSGLSLSGFSKRFKKVFGTAPYRWIMERKGDIILWDLRSGVKSIKQMTEEYGFYSVQHFGYYCKKRFGFPPGRIRQMGKV